MKLILTRPTLGIGLLRTDGASAMVRYPVTKYIIEKMVAQLPQRSLTIPTLVSPIFGYVVAHIV